MSRFRVVVYETETYKRTFEVEAANELDARDKYWETDAVYEKHCDGSSEVEEITLLKEGEEV